MLKQIIEYTDFDGNPQSETWHFHLTKADIVEMQLEFGGTLEEGALEKKVKELFKTKDAKVIIKFFKDMIARSVGRRVEQDGKIRFVRSEEIANEFMQTEAYSTFFMSLVTDANAGAAFFRALVPADLAKNLDKVDVVNGTMTQPEETGETPAEKPLSEYTREELMAIPQAEFDRLVGTDPQKMSRDHLVVAWSRRARAGG